MTADEFRIEIGQGTDPGQERDENQDSLVVVELEWGTALVVADGMGGHKGGSVASQTAVAVIREFIENASVDLSDPEACQRLLWEALVQANTAVYDKSLTDEKLGGMGTTVVIALLVGDLAYVAHVGDSRLYYFQDYLPAQVTTDHTTVQELLNRDIINLAQARNHPEAHKLSRAVGIRPEVDPDVRGEPVRLIQGDVLLLCSDGLTDIVEDQEIADIVCSQLPQDACETLISLANERGAPDNVTIITANVPGKTPVRRQTQLEEGARTSHEDTQEMPTPPEPGTGRDTEVRLTRARFILFVVALVILTAAIVAIAMYLIGLLDDADRHGRKDVRAVAQLEDTRSRKEAGPASEGTASRRTESGSDRPASTGTASRRTESGSDRPAPEGTAPDKDSNKIRVTQGMPPQPTISTPTKPKKPYREPGATAKKETPDCLASSFAGEDAETVERIATGLEEVRQTIQGKPRDIAVVTEAWNKLDRVKRTLSFAASDPVERACKADHKKEEALLAHHALVMAQWEVLANNCEVANEWAGLARMAGKTEQETEHIRKCGTAGTAGATSDPTPTVLLPVTEEHVDVKPEPLAPTDATSAGAQLPEFVSSEGDEDPLSGVETTPVEVSPPKKPEEPNNDNLTPEEEAKIEAEAEAEVNAAAGEPAVK